MSERSHIRNGVRLATFSSEKGRVQLENGGFVSPLVIGYVNGNDKIVEVVRETQDTSTGPDIVTTRTETVEANRVHILTEIRDMTAQEISDRRDAIVNQIDGLEDILRAFALAVLDEFNVHSGRINAILDAIDNGSNLASVKTGIAAINDIPDRDIADLKTAIRNHIGS